jgi:hypothetical protein
MFKAEKFWVSQKSESILAEAGLLDIEAVVGREFDWFETPNQRRLFRKMKGAPKKL